MDVTIEYKLHFSVFSDILKALKENNYKNHSGNQYYKGSFHGVYIFPSHDNVKLRFRMRMCDTSMPEVIPRNVAQEGDEAIRMILQYVTPTAMYDEHNRKIDPQVFSKRKT